MNSMTWLTKGTSQINNGADFHIHREYTNQKNYYIKQQTEFMEENILNIKNQIKAQIMFAGFTMAEVVDALSTEYGWSDSLSNFSAKLSRESLRYKEALELAQVLGYEIVWKKKEEN